MSISDHPKIIRDLDEQYAGSGPDYPLDVIRQALAMAEGREDTYGVAIRLGKQYINYFASPPPESTLRRPKGHGYDQLADSLLRVRDLNSLADPDRPFWVLTFDGKKVQLSFREELHQKVYVTSAYDNDGKTVTVPLDTELSADAVINLFTGGAEHSTGLLPPGVKWVGRDNRTFLVQRPPRDITVTYSTETKWGTIHALKEETADDPHNNITLAVPWQCYLLSFSYDWALRGMWMWFMNDQIWGEDSPVFAAPVTNRYIHGKLCTPESINAELANLKAELEGSDEEDQLDSKLAKIKMPSSGVVTFAKEEGERLVMPSDVPGYLIEYAINTYWTTPFNEDLNESFNWEYKEALPPAILDAMIEEHPNSSDEYDDPNLTVRLRMNSQGEGLWEEIAKLWGELIPDRKAAIEAEWGNPEGGYPSTVGEIVNTLGDRACQGSLPTYEAAVFANLDFASFYRNIVNSIAVQGDPNLRSSWSGVEAIPEEETVE